MFWLIEEPSDFWFRSSLGIDTLMKVECGGLGMAKGHSKKIDQQIKKAGLPTVGAMPFHPQLDMNKMGEPIIKKAPIHHGPKKGKHGYVDTKGRIWIKDRAHGKYPDHWDVQENGGKKGRIRVDPQGNILP